MQTSSANAGFMDLNKAQTAINAIPLVKESIPELMQLADGKVPGIPGYLALAKLHQIQQLVQDLAVKQPPQGTIKDNIAQSMATMMTQQGQQQQAQKPPMPPGGIASLGPVPPNTPQPQMQPEAEPQQGAGQPVQAAHGGIMNAHVDPRMFNFDGGGIVSFAGGKTVTDEEKEKLRNQTRMYIEAAQQKAVEDEQQRAAEKAANDRATEGLNDTVGMGELPRNTGLSSLPDAITSGSNAVKKGIGSIFEPYKGPPMEAGGQRVTSPAKLVATSDNPPVSANAPIGAPGGSPYPSNVRPGAAIAPQAPAAPTTGPMAGGQARPAPVPTVGPMAPNALPAAPQTNDDAIVALANKLTLDNPDAAQAKADRDAIVQKDFDQAKAIADEKKINDEFGVGTYGKNRREQLGQMKTAFEASQPTGTDRVLASMRAFSRPGARAGDTSEASYKMIEAERAARFEFAKAQDLANDAIEKVEEAVRTGSAASVRAAKAESIKAKQTATEKKAELSQKVADNTAAGKRQGVASAAQIVEARARDKNMFDIAANNNVSSEKVARIQAAAQKYGYDKPDAGERALKEYIAIKDKYGEEAADKWLAVTANVRDAVMGVKQRGLDKTIENKIRLNELIRKETEGIDAQLARGNLKPERRAELTKQRKVIEDRVRADFPELGGPAIKDPFKE